MKLKELQKSKRQHELANIFFEMGMDLDLIEQVIKILQKMDYEFVTCYEYFDFRNLENFIHGKIYR